MKRNEIFRNETKPTEMKQNKTKQNKTKRNKTYQHESIKIFLKSLKVYEYMYIMCKEYSLLHIKFT